MSAPAQYQPAPTAQQPAGIATASVVLGAIGFLVGICSIIGLILGLVARGKAKRGEISPARVTAGIVVSAISLGIGLVGWIAIVALVGAGSTADNTTTSSVAAPAQTPAEEVVAAPVETQAPAETKDAAAPAPEAAAPV